VAGGLTQPQYSIVGDQRVYVFTSGTGSISWSDQIVTTGIAEGSYWVIKNNSAVNYTLNFTGGYLNTVGTTSMYLQAGNGMTLIYSGANSVYYTF
jgi:hypothetical protein